MENIAKQQIERVEDKIKRVAEKIENKIYLKYTDGGDFAGFLMSFFNTIPDSNLVEIDKDVHELGLKVRLVLKSMSNIPKEIVTLENVKEYFNEVEKKEIPILTDVDIQNDKFKAISETLLENLEAQGKTQQQLKALSTALLELTINK